MIGLESSIIGLTIIAVLVAVGAQRLRLPYTIAMVLTGLAVSLLQLRSSIVDFELEPHLILVTFLPGLVFEAAYHLDLVQLRENSRTILTLAIPGVLLSMFIIGFLLNQLLGLPLIEALLFGILISATDPISVIALFKELGVTKRLSIIVEGESLFNDGAAIVLYSILLGVTTGDPAFNLASSLTTFFVTVAGGAVLGLATGIVLGEVMRRTDDHVLDIALTVILAYGTYLLAEEVLHGAVSPVIAVVVAAIYVGNYASRGAYSATSNVTIISFWEFVVFLINSAIFLLIGLEISPMALVENIGPVLIGIGVTLLARVLVVYPLRALTSRYVRYMPRKWGHVLFWGGLRGAVSIALVLSLPTQLESRGLLEVMAFGYVLFSLIAQGLTIGPLLKRLGLTRASQRRREYEQHRAQMVMAHAALHAIDELHDENVLSGPVCSRLQETFQAQADKQWDVIEKLVAADPDLVESDVRFVQREIGGKQKQALMRLVRRGMLSEEVYQELGQEIDERVERAHRDDWGPPPIISPRQESLPPGGTE